MVWFSSTVIVVLLDHIDGDDARTSTRLQVKTWTNVDLDRTSGPTVRDMFTDEEIDYLDGQRIGRLATSHADGLLQNNPVGFGVNRALGTIDIGGFNMSRSRKFRNVAENGRAAFVVDDVFSVDPWRVRFLEIRGHAEAIAEPTDPSDQMGAGAIIRLHPTRILSVGLQPGDLDVDPHLARMQRRDVG
jgi:pyridoxamine 5'-phosphate oxidase family protein